VKRVFFYILLLFSVTCYSQVTDSIENIINSKKSNLEKIKHLNILCEDFWMTGNYEDAKVIVNELFHLEEIELNKLPENTDLLKEKAYTYNNLAIIHRFQGNYSSSIDNHLKALKIRETIKDTRGIARSNLGLGSIYNFMGKREEALKYKFIAKKLFEEVHDTLYVAFTCNHIASIYFDMGKIIEAEEYNGQALMVFLRKVNLSGMADAFTLAGQIYETRQEYKDAINNYEGSLNSKDLLGQKEGVVEMNSILGRVYLKMNQLNKAQHYLNEGLVLAKQIGAKSYQRDLYLSFAKMDSISKNYASAFENYKLHIAYRDSLVNEKSAEKITQLQAEFENEKIAQIKALEEEKREAARKEKEYKQRLVLYSISGGLLIMFIFSIFILRSYRAKQKVNKELVVKNEIIAEQKHEVEEKQKEILDSIRYAKRIQMSLLASEKYIHKSIEKQKGNKS
jgi:tetratricopeptide (TPR) repeat protein